MRLIIVNVIVLSAQIIEILIICRVILSWVGHNRYNPLVVQVYKITDPLLKPFQDLLPPENLGLDISPVFAIIAVELVKRFLIQLASSLF
jgi:YggT family protein